MKKYIAVIVIVAIIGYIYYINSTAVMTSKPTPAPTLSAEQVKKRMIDIPLVIPTQDPNFIKQTSLSIYPLTEMAIKLSFNPSSTFKQGSVSEFNRLFSTMIKEDVLNRMKNDGKNVNKPYDISFLQCYALYTNIFLNPFSEDNKDKYQNEYDIIGAYMFLNLKSYLNNDKLFDSCKYYEATHQLYLSKDVLTTILEFTKRVETDNAFFFINVMLPVALDDFVVRIGRYVYSNFAKNYKTINEWINMKSLCS
jgi:hypothetical protein